MAPAVTLAVRMHVWVPACGLADGIANDLRPEQVPASLKWYTDVEAFRGDVMYVLTEGLGKLLMEGGRIPHTVRTGLRARLDEHMHSRNELRYGAWFGFSGDGAGTASWVAVRVCGE